MEFVKESTILQELMQEGYEKGKREATLKALHQALTIRFHIASGDFDERLEQLDTDALEKLNTVALTVQSLAAFEKALADMLSRLEETSPQFGENDKRQAK